MSEGGADRLPHIHAASPAHIKKGSSTPPERLLEPWQQLLLFILHLTCPPPKVYP